MFGNNKKTTNPRQYVTPDRPVYCGLWSSCQLNQIYFLFGKKHDCNCSKVSHSWCLLRGNVSTLETIKKKIREQTRIDAEAAAGTYRYTKAVQKVPLDPCFKDTASKNKTFIYIRDHFTFLRISIIIINSNTEQGIQLRKYQTYLW